MQISGRDQPGSGSTASSRDKESACRPYALRCYVDSVRNVRYITNAGGSSLIATVRCGDASQATHPKWRSWRRLRCCAALALNIVGRTSSFHFMVVSFHGRLISCWSVYQNPGKMPMQARGRLRGILRIIVNPSESESLCYTKCSLAAIEHLNLCLSVCHERCATFKEGIFFANPPLTCCYNCPH